jgi:hypothetical protein
MTTATAICALRPYQAADDEKIRAALIKYRRVVYALATGGGLDHAGNVLRHGDPSQARLWSLEGLPARLRAEAAAREEEERAKRRQQEQVAGQLREWNAQASRRHRLATLSYRRALAECPDEASLHEMAAARGYKPGWIWHVIEQRRAAADAARLHCDLNEHTMQKYSRRWGLSS